MMDEQTKDQLVGELRSYLDTLPAAESVGDGNDSDPSGRGIDLYTLFTELAGLRNEVRLESRQLKRALDEFNNVFSSLEDSSRRLGNELDDRRENEAQRIASARRALLIDLVDLHERLTQALTLTIDHRPGPLERLCARRTNTLFQDLAEGLGITLRRLDQTLEKYGVKATPTTGLPIDPHRMRVSSVRSDPAQIDGVVLEEVRRGYLQGDDVLRLAEVVANRKPDPKQAEQDA